MHCSYTHKLHSKIPRQYFLLKLITELNMSDEKHGDFKEVSDFDTELSISEWQETALESLRTKLKINVEDANVLSV